MPEVFTCPHCGADVPIRAIACRVCGSDRETGWAEGAKSTALLPDTGDRAEYRPAQRRFMAAIAIFLTIWLPMIWLHINWLVFALLWLLGSVIYYGRALYRQQPRQRERRYYQQLLAQTGGDRDLLARIIVLEQQRNPNATRLQLLEQVWQRWQRDRLR